MVHCSNHNRLAAHAADDDPLAGVHQRVRGGDVEDVADCLEHFAERFRAGSLDLDMKEIKIYCDRDGWADRTEVVQHDESHQLIEEFMLLANECVAKALDKASVPHVCRVHDDPDPEKLDALVVINLCVPTASGVPLQLLPKVINGVRIIGIDVPGFPTLIISTMFFAGAQLISLGVIGEKPVRQGTDIGSMYAGIYGIQAINAALLARERTRALLATANVFEVGCNRHKGDCPVSLMTCGNKLNDGVTPCWAVDRPLHCMHADFRN